MKIDVSEAERVIASELHFPGDAISIHPRAIGRTEVFYDVIELVQLKHGVLSRDAGVRQVNLVLIGTTHGDGVARQFKDLTREIGRLRNDARHCLR